MSDHFELSVYLIFMSNALTIRAILISVYGSVINMAGVYYACTIQGAPPP